VVILESRPRLEGDGVITNFKKLSDALDRTAAASGSTPPASDIVAKIRDEQKRIKSDIQQKGIAYVTVDGRKFLVRSS
jgi:hypothetical protein